ncbi:MAG: hypothetical protein ACREPD_04890 [Stenotrophomonas sp.]|uniref:hypothetical protein n=1 Tax=Stenotrophomonas sp. TaxID=69392 RepID=UPI003D6CDD0F
MAETTAQMLTRMTKVTSQRSDDAVNKLLNEGWRLLSVEQVPMRDGGDAWVETKYVLGYPDQDSLAGPQD